MVNTMTTIIPVDQKCSVCGYTSQQYVLGSTNSWGYADLDLRPAPMQRDTMNTWIVECPNCGYVAGNLENESGIKIDFVKSEAYTTCDDNEFEGKLSERFYRGFMIARETNNTRACFFNLHHCAWDCDDHNDPKAIEMRKMALQYLDEMIESADEETNNLVLIKADMLRRTEQFDTLIEEYESVTLDDAQLDRVLKFQIKKAQEKDTACYTGEDVFGR